MKIINIIRRYGAPVLLSLLSASYIAQAQVVNPSQPATGVPLAGTGISVAGQTVSVNYGVANSPFTGNMSVGGTLTAGTFSPTNMTVSGTLTTSVQNASGTTTNSGATVLNGAVSGTGITTYEANLNHVQTVLNVAALNAINCVGGLYYRTQGYYTIGDQGDGTYVCDSSDTTTTTNGGTILAAANTFRLKLQYNGRFTSRQFGAKGDNTTDDTTSIQNFIIAARSQGGNSVEGKWVKGTYKLTAALTIGTNQYLVFDPGTVINFLPADPANTTLFTMAAQTNVNLIGNGATINGSQTTVSSTGSGDAFFIYGTKGVKISGFNINTMATDGVTVTGDNTGSGPATNVILENLIVNGSARNGLSIISARNLLVLGGQYSGSTGSVSGPWAGIDIEPNGDSFIDNVNLVGVSTSGNAGAGIQFTPSAMNNGGNRFSVNITGGRSTNDGGLPATPTVSRPAFYFTNGGAPAVAVPGEINVRGFMVDSPQGAGVGFNNWDGAFMPKVLIDGMMVINPDYTSNAASNYDRVGYQIYTKTAQAVTSQGNIIISNSTAQDTRGSPRMPWGFVAFVDTGKVLSDIQIINPRSINYAASEKADVSTQYTTVAGGGTNVDVFYSVPQATPLSGSTTIADYAGKRINVTASSAQTLPLAANAAGSHYEIKSVGATGVSVVPQTGDTIQWYGWAVSGGLVLDSGGYVSLRSDGGTSWTVETISGQVRRSSTTRQGSIQFAATIPSSGSVGAVGDIAFNIVPAVGQPRGWQCSVGTATTCTTWISMGNN